MKTNLSYLVLIAVLIAVIVLQRECSSPTPCPPCIGKIDTVIIRDTVWVPLKVTKKTKPKLKKSIPPVVIADTFKLPDTTYQSLANKYNQVVKEISTQNIYEDSIHIDSLGYITVTDTIQYNKLQNRTAVATLRVPHVTEKVYVKETLEPKPVRQLYIGGGISTSKYLTNTTAEAGLLFKTKRDNIYGGHIGMTVDGLVMYGFQTYWKIQLHK
jgi:hypothetical protein